MAEHLPIKCWHYPIKGMRGIKLDRATIGPQGFEDDRTFVMCKIHRDEKTNDVTFLETMYSGFHLSMVLFQAIIEDREKGPENAKITVTRVGPENPEPTKLTYNPMSKLQMQFPLRPDVTMYESSYLDMHGSACEVYDMGVECSDFLSRYFGFETKLFYIGNNSRIVNGSGAPNSELAVSKHHPMKAAMRKVLPSSMIAPTERITFQDIGQYLIVTTESNDEVSTQLTEGHTMDIHKFRPNIIVSGAPKAYDEDFWSQLVFPGGLKMNFGGTCWRCQAITIDTEKGGKAEGEEGEVWKRLMKYRRVDAGWKYGPVFGKYSYTSLNDIGRTISVGDQAVVTKRVRNQPVFGEF
jgi:uncharacterized protein YcbX